MASLATNCLFSVNYWVYIWRYVDRILFSHGSPDAIFFMVVMRGADLARLLCPVIFTWLLLLWVWMFHGAHSERTFVAVLFADFCFHFARSL